MTSPELERLLDEILEQLQSSEIWLTRSYEQCQFLKENVDWSPEHYDQLEAMTARFARLSDLLLQKWFRALDQWEMVHSETLLDAALRAEKRGIVTNVDQIRTIREVRNRIAHEYEWTSLEGLFHLAFELIPELITIYQNSRDYFIKQKSARNNA